MGSFSLQNEVLGVLNNVVQEVNLEKIFFLVIVGDIIQQSCVKVPSTIKFLKTKERRD